MKKTITLILCLMLTIGITIIPVFASNIAVNENIDTYSPTFRLVAMSNNGMYQNANESYVFTYDTSGIAIIDFESLDQGGDYREWMQNNSFYDNQGWSSLHSYNKVETVAPQKYRWTVRYDQTNLQKIFYGNNITFFYDSFAFSQSYDYLDIPNISLGFSQGNIPLQITYEFDYSIYDIVTNEIITNHSKTVSSGTTLSNGEFGLQAVDFNKLKALAGNSSNKMVYVQNLTVNVNANSPSGQYGESAHYTQLKNLTLNHIIDKQAPTTLNFLNTIESEEHGLFDFIITSIGGFFSTDLFGTFSIGDLLGVVISIGVLFALLKYFAGG